jgi:protease II
LFEKYIILYLQSEGNDYITVINIETKETFDIDMDKETGRKMCIISPGLNENYFTETFRFHVDTLFEYNLVFDYDIPTRKLKLLEEFNMSGKPFNSKNIKIERLNVPGKDGELIPITLVYDKKL